MSKVVSGREVCGSDVCVEVCEKYLEKQMEVFVAFVDLEKAYDRVDMMAMWEVLRMYGIRSIVRLGVCMKRS
jgi:hypothetical protein